MTKVAGNYGHTLTLLVMPEAERRWRRRDENEEPVEGSYDRFISRGQSRIECRSMTTTLTCFKYRSPAAALRCLA